MRFSKNVGAPEVAMVEKAICERKRVSPSPYVCKWKQKSRTYAADTVGG